MTEVNALTNTSLWRNYQHKQFRAICAHSLDAWTHEQRSQLRNTAHRGCAKGGLEHEKRLLKGGLSGVCAALCAFSIALVPLRPQAPNFVFLRPFWCPDVDCTSLTGHPTQKSPLEQSMSNL